MLGSQDLNTFGWVDQVTCELVSFYQERNYTKADKCADAILIEDPSDMVALYYKGAIQLRLSTPNSVYLNNALTLWSSAIEGLSSDDEYALLASIECELNQIIYGMINQRATYWRTYENRHFADELVSLFVELDSCEQECQESAAIDTRIASMFLRLVTREKITWIALVTGSDIPIPLDLTTTRSRGYADVLACMSCQVMHLLQEGQKQREQKNEYACGESGRCDTADSKSLLVAKRTLSAFERFATHYASSLTSEQKELLEVISTRKGLVYV